MLIRSINGLVGMPDQFHPLGALPRAAQAKGAQQRPVRPERSVADAVQDQALAPLALLLLPLTQAYSRAPAILVDELDAGGFECPADRKVIRRRQRRASLCDLGSLNRVQPQRRLACEIRDSPLQKRTGRTDLCT
jgi:hypothetical protein